MTFINQPFQSKKLTLNSRLVLPPMACNKADKDGYVTQQLLKYYAEKSHGGYFGLIIVEHSFISEQGRAHANQLSIADDAKTDGLSKLATTIHDNGSVAAIQLSHAGGATTSEITGQLTVSPSQVPFFHREGGEKSLDKKEIAGIVQDFAKAAVRAKNAGFDAVEIHSAHGYLLNEFCSPYTNHRSDEYGGDITNRLRIHLKVINAIQKAVGADYPILVRLGACDFIDGGTTVEDAVEMARIFEDAGIDILDISGGLNGSESPGKEHQQGYFSDLTQPIKRQVNLPLILTGGITDIDAADLLIASQKTDLIGVGRAMFKDSNWAEKAFAKLH